MTSTIEVAERGRPMAFSALILTMLTGPHLRSVVRARDGSGDYRTAAAMWGPLAVR